jgi:plastocyanin
VRRIADLGLRIADRIAVIVLATCLTACDDASTANGSPAAPPRVLRTGAGIVRGVVKFDGVPPKMATIANKPCHAGAPELEEETVMVGDGGAMMNVLVFVEGAGSGGDGSQREPAVLDQVHCRYVPHVLGVQVGQTLVVRSSDDTMHNVHYKPDRNAAANFGMTTAGQEKRVTFAAPEFVRVKCDVHPWMTAYVGVFDSPFFTATGVDGKFEIKGLPAGEYTLVAWHELYGRQEQPLKVDEAKPVETTFRYKAP